MPDPLTLIGGLSLIGYVIRLHRRVRALESREWPQRVVEWRPVYAYNPKCRCTTEVVSDG